MDAVKFLKEKNRLCKTHKKQELNACGFCKLTKDISTETLFCDDVINCYPEEAVAIVEKWSKEHPQKTYKDDFLEKFPNAKRCVENDVPYIYWCHLYNRGACKYKKYDGLNLCSDCWNEPMED